MEEAFNTDKKNLLLQIYVVSSENRFVTESSAGTALKSETKHFVRRKSCYKFLLLDKGLVYFWP